MSKLRSDMHARDHFEGSMTDQPVDPSRRLSVVDKLISSLVPHPKNARTHSKKQIHQIAASIQEFGFNNPILIDETGTIIAGHGRVLAAKVLGLATVPTIRVDHLSDAQKRAYIIADNQLAMNAGWDSDMLAIEFQHLASLDLTFEMEITGFDTAEIDIFLDDKKPVENDDDVAPKEVRSVAQTGDIWHLGDHKIVCGDARDPSVHAALLGDERARIVFGDPPYNVKIDRNVSGHGAVKHPEFAMASGEMTASDFTAFLRNVFHNCGTNSINGAIHYWCMDWRHMAEVMAAANGIYSELKNLCVWNKNNGGLGSFYRSKHELVFVYKVGTEPHVNTIELGQSGRYRTNVWDYSGASSGSRNRHEDLAMHPTVKPVAMIADAIKDSSRVGDIVLDPFGGSGSTLMAAERTKRRARLIEIDPPYVDVTIARWEKRTGREAVNRDGVTSAEILRLRNLPQT